MRRSVLFLSMFSIGAIAYAQKGSVGINTEKPKATLHIAVSEQYKTGDSNQGLLIPNLKRSRVANMTAPEDGTLVYVDNLDGSASGKVADITAKGFYYYNNDSSKWTKLSGTVTGTAGANGTNGKDGKTILNGTTPPTSNQGTEGDFYIDTKASNIYGPKTASGWGTAVSLKGPKGDPGTYSAQAIAVATSRNLMATDNGNYLYVTGSNVTLTADKSLSDGFSCVIIQMGSNQVTISGAESARGSKTRTQYSAIGVVKVNGTFVVTGDAVRIK